MGYIRSFFVAVLLMVPAFEGACVDWNEEKSEHFIVFSSDSDSSFARTVLHEAEGQYTRIARYLGYTRHDNFWTWENRVKIYVHPTKNMYLKASRMPDWSEGMAEYTQKVIASYRGSPDFIRSILPHEIAHLLFRDFVGFKGEVPLWLDEGVAAAAESLDREHLNRTLNQYAVAVRMLPLAQMMTMDIRTIKAEDTVSIPSSLGAETLAVAVDGESFLRLYYAQAASVVDFLIERFGTERFARFSRELRDGSSLDDALGRAYADAIGGGTGELERLWLEYVRTYK